MSEELENLSSPLDSAPISRGHGGARVGSGRKRKHDKFGTAIQQAEQKIVDRLPTLIDRMFELADGVTVQEIDQDGGVNVYTRPPEFKALAYLVDRIMGKPTERKEHTFPKPLEDMSDDELRAIVES